MSELKITEQFRECLKDLPLGTRLYRKEIVALLHDRYKTNPNSILPSDYCYNMMNKGIPADHPAFFLNISTGLYEYVGEQYRSPADVKTPDSAVHAAAEAIPPLYEQAEIILDTKLVGSISGCFYVPSYQRGYRWGSDEVNRLLDDIYTNGDSDYCLQPIVVKKDGDRFELIDGQQRLTTLYLIYKYMHDASGGFLDEPKFSLEYQTREKSQGFLKSIDMSRKNDNIDFWHICNAYSTIEEWFSVKGKKSTLTNINKYLDERVQVIWYEVDSSQDSIGLFTRLNIGKIRLTSAELVKAMFLCRRDTTPDTPTGQPSAQQRLEREKQEEISLQWDTIERQLHDDGLWYFLTNTTEQSYQTRIDLVLDMMAKKPVDSKEVYFTYFEFEKMRKAMSLDKLWREIQNSFLILKDWYEDHDFYHKIGYLITVGTKLIDIYQVSRDKTKAQFRKCLDEMIKESVAIDGNYGDLSYEKKTDYDSITKLLILFNVESVHQNGEQTMWFPFDKFKFDNGKKVAWSLEHIHAQQSDGLRSQEVWKEWLRLHLPSIKTVGSDASLVEQMESAIENERLGRKEFEELQQQVVALLSSAGSTEYLHSISNLALLNTADNAALNNATFDVKRTEIIRMDKAGQYIPYCTKMVFLKYYTESADSQLHFWGQRDREAYVQEINRVLQKYLPGDIVLTKEAQ